MSLAISMTRTALGIHAQTVSVEVHLSGGLPGFTIVGLAETAVRESRDRVRSAIINSQFEFPCRRITVNLAPADLPKSGSGFDLAIAIGILAASEQISNKALSSHYFVGELALNGDLRPVSGVMPLLIAAEQAKQPLILPKGNAAEAAIIASAHISLATSLREVCHALCYDKPLPNPEPAMQLARSDAHLDWSDVKGQGHAKKALEIAAVGGHSVLLSGPPGSGKTMLASRFGSLLPELAVEQALETAAIRSISQGKANFNHWRQAPFRSPHHSASQVALVGGGNPPRPGEISLAHHGVLFLDELPEFQRPALESLREPLESGKICISRASIQHEFPADFQLVAAMNPCPCGQAGNPQGNCLCSPERIQRYLSKLSGPLLDRIDMHIPVQALSDQELIDPQKQSEAESPGIRARVAALRQAQIERQGCLNSKLAPRDLDRLCLLAQAEQAFLAQVLSKLKLSARGYHRLLKVARTIADMAGKQQVSLIELQQALGFRQHFLRSSSG